jgi:hypothetical protein
MTSWMKGVLEIDIIGEIFDFDFDIIEDGEGLV